MLRPGDTFLDVEANVGYFSLIAAQLVGDSGEVHAFEPDGLAHSLLIRSAAENGLSNVWCHRIGLWSDDAVLDLVHVEDSAYQYVRCTAPTVDQPVRGVRLDQYAACVGIRRPIRLVKIDVEGAEVEALRGMREILSSDRPALIVECQDPALARFGHRMEDIFADLDADGYRATSLEGQPVSDATTARAVLAGHLAPNLVFEAR